MNKFNQKRILTAFMAIAFLITAIMGVPAATSAASSTSLKRHVNIGYWLGGNGGTNKTLAEAAEGWDVIVVSFIETRGNYYTPNLNMDLSAVYPGTEEQQIAAFKADIRTLQALGKKIVISCGGQNGVVHIDNATQRDIFLNGVKAIIDEYGFDGFDVDFEGSSISCMYTDRIGDLKTQQSINLEYILRDLKNTYGPEFIISAAPEYCYVQGGAISTGNNGAFLPFLDAIRDILTYIHPQYYNGFNGDFTWLQPSANAGEPFKQVYSAEGYVRLSEMLITGFETMDKGTFVGLDPSQVAFGVPARNGAGNGAQDVSVYASALTTLLAKYPTYRGIMTWSIGWDESGGDKFVNAIAPIIAEANGTSTEPGQPIVNAQLPTITSQPADKTVNINDSAKLEVSATVSEGTLSYQWYKASSKVNTGGTAIIGATSATYDAPVNTAGKSYYYCVVTNTNNAVSGTKIVSRASAAVTVTVNNPDAPAPEGDTWQSDTIYTEGQTVVYEGQTYVCKWWTKGDIPSAGGPWELQSDSSEYVPGKAYTGGSVVVYQGQSWRANWWTTATPGSDSSWSLV